MLSTCPSGHQVEIRYWEVLDEASRPELVAAFAGGRLGRTRCEQCGQDVAADAAVTVIRRASDEEIAVVFASGTDEATQVEPVELTIDSAPLTTVSLPFEAAPVVLRRDLAADLSDVEGSLDEVSHLYGDRIGDAYRHFLFRITHRVAVDHFGELVDRVIELRNAQELASLVESWPEMLSDVSLALLEQASEAMPGQIHAIEALRTLITDAPDDIERAWTRFAASTEATESRLKSFEPLVENLSQLVKEGQYDAAIIAGERLIEELEEMGAPITAGAVDDIVALALVTTRTGDHADNIERALGHRRRAVDRALDDDHRAMQLAQLGLTYGIRVKGDLRANREAAFEALDQAHTIVSASDDRDILAWAQMNLALALENRLEGDRTENLRRAYQLCRASAGWRKPERNPVDWAYAQVNLGNIIQNDPAAGRRHRRQARRAFKAVAQRASEIQDKGVVATALTNLGNQARDAGTQAWWPWIRRRRLLRSAQAFAAAAAVADEDPVLKGRALNLLADVQEETEGLEAAFETARAAFDTLRPSVAPAEASRAAARYGWLLAARGAWDAAADAYADALTAANLSYYSRALAGDRAAERESHGPLNRWAAYAFARAGRLREAVLALEDGRMRELRRRFPPSEDDMIRLARVSPALYDEYVAALSDLAHAHLADDADLSARLHHSILERIRVLPEFESFGGQVGWATIDAAPSAGSPIVFVNPTPWGTVLLTLAVGASGSAAVHAAFLATTSTAIADLLLFGGGLAARVSPPYALAVSSGRPRDISTSLQAVLDWLGPSISRHIDDELTTIGATSVTLIISGPLALAPLQAASWSAAGGGAQMLLERYAVAIAPSATSTVIARRRASRVSEGPRLVGLADPRPGPHDLPAARAELASIADHFAASARTLAFGTDATSVFLVREARSATHLHLACHARGVPFNFRETSLQLADGDFPLTRVAALGELRVDLAVVSACETGVADQAEASEEVYSIGSVLLAAGCATVVTSSWAIDDYASALLIIRFYDELGSSPKSPGEALRRAQLWLRDVDSAEHDAFVARHPLLIRERTRRRHAVDTEPGGLSEADLAFKDPYYWSCFALSGALDWRSSTAPS